MLSHQDTPTKQSPGFQDDESTFPFLVYDLLEDAEKLGFTHTVSWSQDGTSFMVHDRKIFTDQILPIYFKQSQFKSFQRQLNFYAFDRVRIGPLAGKQRILVFWQRQCASNTLSLHISLCCSGSYAHPDFRRGSRRLCHLITRTSTTKANRRPRKATKRNRADKSNTCPKQKNTVSSQQSILQRDAHSDFMGPCTYRDVLPNLLQDDMRTPIQPSSMEKDDGQIPLLPMSKASHCVATPCHVGLKSIFDYPVPPMKGERLLMSDFALPQNVFKGTGNTDGAVNDGDVVDEIIATFRSRLVRGMQ